MKQFVMKLNYLTIFLMIVCEVSGHSFLVFPPPRVNHQGSTFGHKNSDPRLDRFWPRILDQGPTCRIASNNYPPPGRPMRTFMAGEIIPVTFNIRIPHPSPPGFVIAVWYSNSDNFQNNILMADFNPPEQDAYWGAGQYTFHIKLPNKPCQSCTFLWAWGSLKDQGFYLDCADIQILSQRAPNVPATLIPERLDSCFTLSKKTCELTPGCRALWGLAVVTTNKMVYLGCASTQNCQNDNNREKRQFGGLLGGLFGGGGGRAPGGFGASSSSSARAGAGAPPAPAPGGFGGFGNFGNFGGLGNSGGGGGTGGGNSNFRALGLEVDPHASGCPDHGCGLAPPQFTSRDPGICIEPTNVPNNIHFIVDTCVSLDGYRATRCPQGVGMQSSPMGAGAPLALAAGSPPAPSGGKDSTLTIVLISVGGVALLAAVVLLIFVVWRKHSEKKPAHTPSGVVYF